VIAAIMEPITIEKILKHMGLPHRACKRITFPFGRSGFWARPRRDDDSVLVVRRGGATKGWPKRPSPNGKVILLQALSLPPGGRRPLVASRR
jgi:hypothetical protein